ncbi:FGGY-family carbohydrate kinase [Microbacterium sp. NPDC076911]|uniref:FGGY-family carbohydrate kinase n=1 Tax=Microbacterium sp. NPDC076911 TaxID=3154958 RepID=UPI003443C64B
MTDAVAPAWLAIDLGSSSGRVMLGVRQCADERNRTDRTPSPTLVITEAARFTNVPLDTEHGFGGDIGSLWISVREGLRAGIAEATKRRAVVVQGIGVDSWGVDYARVTSTGEIRPFVAHHRDVDTRLAAQASAARDAARDYAEAGVLDQAINTVHQLRRDERDGRGSADHTILLIADLFVYLLTGVAAAEVCLASSTALVDRATGTLSVSLAADTHAKLPPIARGGERAGNLLPGVAAEIGAPERLGVWFVTAHDTAAAFSAVVDAGESHSTAVISCGSWSVVGAAVERPYLKERARRAGLTQEMGAAEHTLVAKNLSGMWRLQQTMREWAERDGKDELTVGDLRELLADAAESPYRDIFDPADPIFQTPGSLAQRLEAACRAHEGTEPASRADLVRAILESLASAYALTLTQLERLTGQQFGSVRIIGGGARNELLATLTSEYTGLPMHAGPVEASSRGVIYQPMPATGHVGDLAAARKLTADDGENLDLHFLSAGVRPAESDS